MTSSLYITVENLAWLGFELGYHGLWTQCHPIHYTVWNIRNKLGPFKATINNPFVKYKLPDWKSEYVIHKKQNSFTLP